MNTSTATGQRNRRKDTLGQTQIFRDGSLLRIVAHSRETGNEVMVASDELNWNDADDFGGWITLDEIASQLHQSGFEPTFYVWDEDALEGTIYQFGNSIPESWVEHGKTRGFA